MKLAHGAWLDREKGSGEVAGDRERLWVNDLETSARDLVRRLLAQVVAVSVMLWDDAGWSGDVVVRGVVRVRCAFEDVKLALGDLVESRGVCLEVLRKDRLWVPLEELGDKGGAVFAERTIVKDEKEFAAFL